MRNFSMFMKGTSKNMLNGNATKKDIVQRAKKFIHRPFAYTNVECLDDP